MRANRTSAEIISKTFFISQLSAIAAYGLVVALTSILANDLAIALAAIAASLLFAVIVCVLHLPSSFAAKFSTRALSIIAIIFSILAVIYFYSGAAFYFEVPQAIFDVPDVQGLRTVAVVGVVAFSLALVANLVAVGFIAIRSPDSDG